MAAGDISVVINSETKGFKQAVQNGIIEPLEDAEKALEDLGKSRGGDQLEREMKTAQTATEKLQDELTEAARDLDKLGFAAKDAGDDGRRGLDRIKAGAQEVQQEVGQNLGEAVSSIRGDFSDLGQVGQDTLGGLAATVSSMGPAGLAGAFALAAGAVGLGAFTAAQEEAAEKQEELNAKAAEWADAYTNSAGRIVDASYIVSEILGIATDPERYKEATDAAKEWGVDIPTAMRAMAGDADALAIAQEGLANRTKEATDNMSEAEQNISALGDGFSSLPEDIKSGQERLDELNGTMAAGRLQALNAAQALYDYATSAGVATGETDDLGNKIYELPSGKTIVVDAKTQTAYEDIDAIEKQKLNDKEITVRVRRDSRDWDNWQPSPKTGVIMASRPRNLPDWQ